VDKMTQTRLVIEPVNNKYGLKRQEYCTFDMKLTTPLAEKYKETIETLLTGKSSIVMQDDDSLKLNYHFFIQYYGDVAEKLAAVEHICRDPDIIVSVDCELLEKAQCLVYNALHRLNEVIRIVKSRECLSEL
jgi:hypothetical protein